ncbi:MAG: zinc-binding dehydrogenase, partial [candidate division NC10 bacterium]
KFKAIKKEITAKASEWGCGPHGWTIFECSGHPRGQETAFGLLGTAGTLMVGGFTLEKIEVRLSNLMAYDATVQGTWGCRPELYPEALRLVTDGRVTLKPFIERHPMSHGPEILRRVADHEIQRRAILEPDWPS